MEKEYVHCFCVFCVNVCCSCVCVCEKDEIYVCVCVREECCVSKSVLCV